MFTGLIEDLGMVVATRPIPGGLAMRIQSRIVVSDLKVGDSIAINGVCLTATQVEAPHFWVEAVQETLEKSTLGELKIGTRVNLERAVRFGDRMGGHFVQGHVDGQGLVIEKQRAGSAVWFSIQIPDHFDRYIIPKGSIAIDGISLTVVEHSKNTVKVSIIPHTYQNTNLQFLQRGDPVNLELDMMAKYIESLLQARGDGQKQELTEDWLRAHGFF